MSPASLFIHYCTVWRDPTATAIVIKENLSLGLAHSLTGLVHDHLSRQHGSMAACRHMWCWRSSWEFYIQVLRQGRRATEPGLGFWNLEDLPIPSSHHPWYFAPTRPHLLILLRQCCFPIRKLWINEPVGPFLLNHHKCSQPTAVDIVAGTVTQEKEIQVHLEEIKPFSDACDCLFRKCLWIYAHKINNQIEHALMHIEYIKIVAFVC